MFASSTLFSQQKRTIQILVELVKLFHIGGPYHIETNPLIWFLYDRDLRHESVKI